MIKYINSLRTFFLLGLVVLLASCGGSDFKKSPLDELIKKLPQDQPFSIVLYDMDVQGNFFETFHHQYRVIQVDGEEVDTYETPWYEVSEREFEQHINDMGMTVASRDSTGKLIKTAMPPGYNNFVGNPKYGQWQRDSSGSSFWAFYGKYAFMSSMFNMMTYPARRSYYDDWRGGYYGTGRRYYGPTTGGYTYYGTNSRYNRSSNSRSTWSRNRSSFKQRVSNRTSRSSSSGGFFRSKGGSFGK